MTQDLKDPMNGSLFVLEIVGNLRLVIERLSSSQIMTSPWHGQCHDSCVVSHDTLWSLMLPEIDKWLAAPIRSLAQHYVIYYVIIILTKFPGYNFHEKWSSWLGLWGPCERDARDTNLWTWTGPGAGAQAPLVHNLNPLNSHAGNSRLHNV